MYKRFRAFAFFCFFVLIAFTQQENVRTTVIYLEQSHSAVRRESMPDVQIIFGDLEHGRQVRFRHDGAVMYSDSAHINNRENTFNAFGNVRIIEGDSIFIYGDYLFYDGNTRFARLRQNARLISGNATLTTDLLNYDRNLDLAFFSTGGKLEDGQNTLTSVWGQFSPATNQAVFRNNVRLKNENLRMYSDTLRHNTASGIADIVGFTHIIHNDETNIFTTLGWHNTETEQSMLFNRSLIVHEGGRTITGDTLFHDAQKQFVEAFSRVEMVDSTQQATLRGNYVFFNELTEFGFASGEALFIDWSTEDRLYLHADTLQVSKDSIFDVFRALHNVRFYRSDLQGASDSLVYHERSSTATMFGQPVVWSGENQLSGEIIRAYIVDEVIERIHIPRNALIVQYVEDELFNQLSGRELVAFMRDGELHRVQISGNAETIYFPINDSDSTIIGINKTESSYVNMFFRDQTIERIVLTTVSTGVMHPLDELSDDEMFLNGFFWLAEQQPRRPEDVFKRFDNNRHASSVVRVRSATMGGAPAAPRQQGATREADHSVDLQQQATPAGNRRPPPPSNR